MSPSMPVLSAVAAQWADRPPEETLHTAALADELGYPELWIGEHATYDAFSLATAIGLATGRIPLTIGPLAVGVRDPAMIAMGVASVAALVRRPVRVALGTPPPGHRGANPGGPTAAATTLAESARTVRALLAGETVTPHTGSGAPGPGDPDTDTLKAGASASGTPGSGAPGAEGSEPSASGAGASGAEASAAAAAGAEAPGAGAAGTGAAGAGGAGASGADAPEAEASGADASGADASGADASGADASGDGAVEGRRSAGAGFRLLLEAPGGEVSVAALGARAVEAAAGQADRMVVDMVSVESAARLRGELDRAAEEAGRPAPRLAAWLPAAVDPAPEALAQLVRALVPYLGRPGYRDMFTDAGYSEVVELARSGAGYQEIVRALPLEILGTIGLVGDRASIAKRLGEYAAAGVDEVAIVATTAGDRGGAATLTALHDLR